MGEDRYVRRAARLLWIGLVLAALWAGIRWLLPLAAPFLGAAVLAWLAESPVRLLTVRCHLPRRLAAALCILGAAALTGGAAFLLLRRLWYEVIQLAGQLPALLADLSGLTGQAEEWLYRLFVALPDPLREPARQGVAELAKTLLALPGMAGEALTGRAAGLLAGLPTAGLSLFTMFLAAYFLIAGRPGLKAAFAQLPPLWQERLTRWRRVGGRAAGGWLRAQGLLLLATFLQVAVGLLLLGVRPAVLLAGLTALVDALPVFGSGTVLLPWGAWALLRGDPVRGLGLLLLYGVVTVVRSLLEPRLVGRQAGLPPLAALVSLYAGFRAFGVLGLLLAPLAAVVAWQLWLGREEPCRQQKGTASRPSPCSDPPDPHL